jgi:hypothetical protein
VSTQPQTNLAGFGKFSFDVGDSSHHTRYHKATILLTGLSSTDLSHFEVANTQGNRFAVHLF